MSSSPAKSALIGQAIPFRDLPLGALEKLVESSEEATFTTGEELIPEEGESRADVQRRTRQFILEMEALKMGDRLLIVGHSHWNRQFLSDLLDVPEENWDLLSSSHTGLTALCRDAVDSPWRCLFLDDTSHLAPPPPEPSKPEEEGAKEG
jgi:broad specificity phosphatase PhoE